MSGSVLTRAEREVVEILVVTGMSNRQLARELQLSEKTIKWRLSSAMRRIGVQSRTELVVVAWREGWVRDATDDRATRHARAMRFDYEQLDRSAAGARLARVDH